MNLYEYAFFARQDDLENVEASYLSGTSMGDLHQTSYCRKL